AAERIRQIETRYDFLQYEIDGWCAWVVLRFSVAVAFANEPMVSKSNLSALQQIGIAVADIAKLLRVRTARFVVKTFTSGLVEKTGGRYKDVWFDDLLAEVGDHFKIETVNNPNFLKRRHEALIRSDLTTTCFDIAARILARFG